MPKESLEYSIPARIDAICFRCGVLRCLFLPLGFMTRISAGALGVTMIVAIESAKWGDVDSPQTLLGFDQTEYLALFLWLAIAGAGSVSIDRLLKRT
jgi:putative oxidoreductase